MNGDPQLRIDVARSEDDIDRLRTDWQRLSAADTSASVFTSWAWQSAWWRQYGRSPAASRQPCILVATLASSGEVVGILPAYSEQAKIMRFLPLRKLGLIGTGGDTSPDYLNPLIQSGYEEAACEAFAAMITRMPWSVLAMHDLGPGSQFRDAMVAALGSAGIHSRTGDAAEISWTELPGEWSLYLASLSSNRRYQIRKQRRDFEARGDSRFYVWQDGDTLDSAIDALIRLHLKRWQSRADEHAFSSENYIEFHRSVIHELFGRGELRLYCLELGGELVAMLYCYRWKDGIYYFQGGFDPDYENLRVGNVVMGYAVEHAIEEKNRIFNMLKGDYRYKRSLAKNTDRTWYVTASRNSVPGLIYRLRYESLPKIKKSFVRSQK